MRRHELDTGKSLLLLLLLLLFSTAIAVPGCDKGTDVDDGDDDEPSPDLPALVQVGSEADLAVAFAPGDSVHVDYNLMGHWAIATDSLCVLQGGVQVESGPARFGAFQMAIFTPLVRIAGSDLVAGSWFVIAGPTMITIEVTPDADGGGTPGVALSYMENGLPSGDSTLVWSDFMDPAAGAPDWIELAAFGHAMLGVAVRHLGLSISDLSYAVDLDDHLVEAGGIGVTTHSAPYPGSGESGAMTCRWLDADQSGALGPADIFSYSRHHWWLEGPGPNRGFVLSGDWALHDYFENRDPVIAIGGVLAFADLQWSPARRDGGVWSVETPGVIVVGTGANYLREMSPP